MVIAITKAEAKANNIAITYESDQEYEQYWCFINIRNKLHVLRLQPHSYFCLSISRYPEDKTNEYLGKEFGIIQNASLRAKIRTVRSKATSLIGAHTNDPQEIKNIINGIPWQFLEFKTPEELASEIR